MRTLGHMICAALLAELLIVCWKLSRLRCLLTVAMSHSSMTNSRANNNTTVSLNRVLFRSM